MMMQIPAPKNLSKDVTEKDYYETYKQMLIKYHRRNRRGK